LLVLTFRLLRQGRPASAFRHSFSTVPHPVLTSPIQFNHVDVRKCSTAEQGWLVAIPTGCGVIFWSVFKLVRALDDYAITSTRVQSVRNTRIFYPSTQFPAGFRIFQWWRPRTAAAECKHVWKFAAASASKSSVQLCAGRLDDCTTTPQTWPEFDMAASSSGSS
jgi:hypothetical protein